MAERTPWTARRGARTLGDYSRGDVGVLQQHSAAMSKENRRKVRGIIPTAFHDVRKPQQSDEREYVCWRFSIMDRGGPFSFEGVKAKVWKRILEKLRQWDSMTWGEIEGPENHAISVEQLSPQARNRLMEINQDDIDEVFSLRLTGRERLIGIRDRHVLRVLWWDPEHGVCPSSKKHT